MQHSRERDSASGGHLPFPCNVLISAGETGKRGGVVFRHPATLCSTLKRLNHQHLDSDIQSSNDEAFLCCKQDLFRREVQRHRELDFYEYAMDTINTKFNML